MKVQRFILWIALFAAAATGLWSCTQEMDGPGTTDPDKTEDIAGYIGIRLKNSDATDLDVPTIDGTFNPGEEEEWNISSDPKAHALLMFDAEGNWFGAAELGLDDPMTTPNGTYYKAQIHFKDGQLPEKLLAVINAGPAVLGDLIDFLNDLPNDNGMALRKALQYLTAGTNAFYTDGNGEVWFTMTSSVYGDRENGNTILAAVPYDETPLSNYIFTNEEDILQNPLTLYVERVVAKFTVYFTGENGPALLGEDPLFISPGNDSKVQYLEDWTAAEAENGDASEEKSWKVHIANWDINAVEPNTFLFKNLSNSDLSNSSEDLTVDMSFSSELWWNTFSPQTRPRSYWAVDPHYDGEFAPFVEDDNLYPYQYRFYEGSDRSYESDEGIPSQKAWALDYFSYDKILTADRSNKNGSRYGIENTFDPKNLTDDLDDNGHLRVGTHILLAAQLLIEDYDEVYDKEELVSADPENNPENKSLVKDVKTKYFDGALFLSEKAMVKRSVYSLANQLFGKGYKLDDKTYASVDGKFYVNTGTEENSYEEISYDEPATDAEKSPTYVMNLFTTVPAYIEGGDGWATIGLKTEETTEVYINTDKGYQSLGSEAIKTLVRALIDPVRAFTNGMMYYAIPVLHEKQFDANGKFDASNLQIGDVGVVRNHWYRVTVGSINTLGTPVHDPGQPIIPNHEPEFWSLGVQIEILPWSVIRLDDTIL